MSRKSNDDRTPMGHMWLRERFNLSVPLPYIESYMVAGSRRTEIDGSKTVELYPRPYATGDDIVANLRFALRYEPIDLGIFIAALEAVPPGVLKKWVLNEPTGQYARRAWFFFEHFTGRKLDLPDLKTGNYVEALDSKRHITAKRQNSTRHRVANNLLGTPKLCPTVRLTSRLEAQIGVQIDSEARQIIEKYDPIILARAVRYLYTKETKSSFAIEGEIPTQDRAERFIATLRSAAEFDPADQKALVRLQNTIVDPRYRATGWRDFQNFVGETTVDFREEVHFICPKPEDVSLLMNGWIALTKRMIDYSVEPVVAAAVAAFSFVFIHPFEDGNGRIHRFMIHHVLSRTGFSPNNMIFPVSAAIARDHNRYDAVLESFSQPLLEFIDWFWTPKQEIKVKSATYDLYRFFDATLFAEYLYDRVVDTVRTDLRQELGFLTVFDQAMEGIRSIVDMPDRRAALLIRLMLQNGGQLSKSKRLQFKELKDRELAAMEAVVKAAMDTGHYDGKRAF